MQKNIVLDLDGVIADIGSAIDDYFQSKNIVEYDYSKWLLTDTKSRAAINLFSDPIFWKNMKPIKDSWHQVNDWFTQGVNVHIVTARRTPQSMQSTIPWLESWNINTLVPHFTGLGKKISIIKDIKPVCVVEDNPHEIKILEEAGFKCFLMKSWYNENYWDSMNSISSLREIDLESL